MSSFENAIALACLARKVKMADDIRDDLDLTRLPTVTDKDQQRGAEYHRALTSLLGVE
jgi:hypothetical protein